MKKLVIVIISILLTILSINLCIKNIIIKTLNDSFTTNVVGSRMDKITDVVNLNLSKYNTIQLSNDIRESSEMIVITKLYLNNIVNDLLNNTDSTVDINYNMQNIVDATFSNYEIADDKEQSVRDIINRQDGNFFYKSLHYMVKNSINSNSLVHTLLIAYNVLTNTILRVMLILLIIGLYVFTYFKKKDLSYTLYIISKSLLVASAIMLGINMVFANYGMGILYAVLGKVATMDFNGPILMDLLCFVFGLGIDIFIKKDNKKKNIVGDLYD